MLTSKIKEKVARLGLRASRRVELMNQFLEYGRWLRAHEPKLQSKSRPELFQHLNDHVLKNAPVDYLEFGVAGGRSIKHWVQLNRAAASRFHGFDTFEGIPEDWLVLRGVIPKGSYSVQGRLPSIDDERVRFHKGLFQETLPGFLETHRSSNRLVVHCDADLYTSTLYVLATLNDRIVPGTTVIFDEFCTMGEFRAFTDYTATRRRSYMVLASAGDFCLHTAIEIR